MDVDPVDDIILVVVQRDIAAEGLHEEVMHDFGDEHVLRGDDVAVVGRADLPRS